MAAKSRNSNGSPSNDDKMEETPAENAVHDMTENGQGRTVEDQTVTVVESQVSVDINPLENDAFDKEEEVEVGVISSLKQINAECSEIGRTTCHCKSNIEKQFYDGAGVLFIAA